MLGVYFVSTLLLLFVLEICSLTITGDLLQTIARRDRTEILTEHIKLCMYEQDSPLCRKLEYILHYMESRNMLLAPPSEFIPGTHKKRTSDSVVSVDGVDYSSVFENFILKNRFDVSTIPIYLLYQIVLTINNCLS